MTLFLNTEHFLGKDLASFFLTSNKRNIYILRQNRCQKQDKVSYLFPTECYCGKELSIIEMIHDELKNIALIEHSRHSAFHHFVVNPLSGIEAYCFFS